VHAPCEDKNNDIKNSFYKELGHVSDQFPTQNMKLLLGDFKPKVGREDIFKQKIGNGSSHEIINDNGIRVVNSATYKNLLLKSTEFSHRDIHKYRWTSPEGKMHSQIDHT
jgi:hypothetical protein